MRLNCLILAHKNLVQLKRLTKKLNHPQISTFIHIDKKWKLSESEIDSIIECADNVTVLSDRINTRLDDWSLVQASIKLLNTSSLRGEGYFLLMSGQDYPIRPIEELLSYLELHYPRPFIDCTPLHSDNWVWHKFSHPALSIIRFKSNSRILQSISIRFLTVFEKIVPKSRVMINRLKKYNLSLYGGSAWWCLPDIAVNEILDDIKHNSNLIKEYKKTWTPEETFFQTFIMRTSLYDKVELNPFDQENQNCLTFASFTTPNRSFNGHPHVLETCDFNWLMTQDAYIARKFDTTTDIEILNMIDIEHCKLQRNNG